MGMSSKPFGHEVVQVKSGFNAFVDAKLKESQHDLFDNIARTVHKDFLKSESYIGAHLSTFVPWTGNQSLVDTLFLATIFSH